ncbi:MAG: hypothetical protein K2N51_02595 [Lachnospiraceae bacterium]|nr:hypothetical protein [Lachnospiraceae bacterium]
MTMLLHDKEIAMEAREEGRNELVQNMLLENMNISFIVKISKLPEETVREIKGKLVKEGKCYGKNNINR